MVSSVMSRPNHYEVLGLAPTANEGEIARAFASRMSLFGSHAPGDAARICAAYEILRDAGRRRDYDRSIGLGPKPEPRQWAFAVTQTSWPGFVGSAAATKPTETTPTPPAPEPLVTAPQGEPSPEIERASAIAASLRRLAEPATFDAPVIPQAQPQPQPLLKPDPVAETDIYRILERGAAAARSRSDEQPFEWRRPALVVGGLIGAAGLIGAFAGLSVKDDAASAAAPPAVTVPLPVAKQVAEVAPAAAAAPLEMAAVPSPATPRHSASQSRFARTAEREFSAAAAQPQGLELASAETETDATDAQPVAASLPLPDAVVARTIERIGYSCGKVTGAVAGASPGVYQVTCSSGDTYQATPVHGRYRFRRSR